VLREKSNNFMKLRSPLPIFPRALIPGRRALVNRPIGSGYQSRGRTAPTRIETKMNESGSSANIGAIDYADEAVETARRPSTPRPSNRGLGATLLIIIFAVVAFGVQLLWLGFLSWILIRAIF
jgi:hypothetical protein